MLQCLQEKLQWCPHLDEQLEVSVATEESRNKEFLYSSYGFPYDVYDKV